MLVAPSPSDDTLGCLQRRLDIRAECGTIRGGIGAAPPATVVLLFARRFLNG
ncbi:hypothetical protein BDZ89DRAFT_1066500 [Hymenopellis radicata]|nr:hypothetical protein BDZ89DRAFT_1066500 [Hymenopellis radicata]